MKDIIRQSRPGSLRVCILKWHVAEQASGEEPRAVEFEATKAFEFLELFTHMVGSKE